MKPRDFQGKARRLGPCAIRTLKRLMQSEDDNIALAATREVLDRAYGKTASTGHDPWEEDFAGVNINEILKGE